MGSLLQKLKEVTSVKEKLALNNQALKFRVAELQKEEYSLSQLNKKLTIEINKTRREEQAVVVLLKKDFNVMLGNYYKMADELGKCVLIFRGPSRANFEFVLRISRERAAGQQVP